jgi:3-oxoacyl-[acyl-carrier-protein] synthase I
MNGTHVAPIGVLSGAAAVTSIGYSGPSSFAAAHAGIAGTVSTERFPRLRGGRPIRHSSVAVFNARTTPGERMLQLALHGAREVLRDHSCRDPLPVLLAVPPVRPGWPEQDAQAMASHILRSLPVCVDRERSGLYPGGAEAGLMALIYAVHIMRTEGVRHCLVGGVDSLLDPHVLDWFDALGRLPSRDDPAGMLPGEGASWLLLRAPSAWQPGDVLLMGVGQSAESSPWYEGAPTVGDGLTEAIRTASQAAGEVPAAIVMSDLNGEDWKVREWTCAYMRNASTIGHPLDLRHPASCWGDLGAASGVALVGLASWVLGRWSEAYTRILVTGSADTTPLRAACMLMSTADGERRP